MHFSCVRRQQFLAGLLSSIGTFWHMFLYVFWSKKNCKFFNAFYIRTIYQQMKIIGFSLSPFSIRSIMKWVFFVSFDIGEIKVGSEILLFKFKSRLLQQLSKLIVIWRWIFRRRELRYVQHFRTSTIAILSPTKNQIQCDMKPFRSQAVCNFSAL